MSGQQATTLGGQVIGGLVGGSVGAAVGGLVGGVIGGALFNKDAPAEGRPALADARVQTSAYGGAVPILFGKYRFAGNVIWSSDIRTVVTETEVEVEGGKGGGKPTVRETAYFVDLAIGMCEGEITALEKIYSGGVLLYDSEETTTMPSGVYLRDKWVDSVTVYLGTETQLPDATIEAAVGVGNCSAYRGLAYVVLTNLNLTALKTTVIPSFEVLAIRGATVRRFHAKLPYRVTAFEYEKPGALLAPTTFPGVRIANGTVRIAPRWNNLDLYWNTTNDSTPSLPHPAQVELWTLDGEFLGFEGRDDFENSLPWARVRDEGAAGWVNNLAFYIGLWALYDETPVYAVASNVITDPPFYQEFYFGNPPYATKLSELISFDESPKSRVGLVFCADNRHILVVLSSGAQLRASLYYLIEWTGVGINIVKQGPCIDVVFPFQSSPLGTYDEQTAMMESDLRHIWIIGGPSGGKVPHVYWINDADELVWLAEYSNSIVYGTNIEPLEDVTETQGVGGELGKRSAIYADLGIAATVCQSQLTIFQRDYQTTAPNVPLSAVLTELCVRSGIAAEEVDASNVDGGDSPAHYTSMVTGYLIAKSTNARSAIESLRPGYFFDAVDGDKLKFILRGAAPVATFDNEDLGAGEDLSRDAEVEAMIEQPTELPSRVNVRYVSRHNDYQWAAQSAQRETTPSVEVLDAEIPCVFDDWHAALIAENNLRDIWASAGKRSFSTSVKYAKYEPTDIVYVDDGTAVRQVRLTRRADRGCLIEWEAEDVDALMYESRSSQIDFRLSAPPQRIAPAIPIDVEALDVPPLTELSTGVEIAVYVAAGKFAAASGWAGANLDLSRDGGIRFVPGVYVEQPSVIGVTRSALRSFPGGNIFDTTSRIRVYVNSGTLESKTFEQVLDGANAAVIGSEIVQFVYATLVDTNLYELTHFLRGRKGTEWAIGTHATYERFVLLTTRLRDLTLDLGDRDSDLLRIRGSGTGSASLVPTFESFDTQLARVMPYSPVHLTAVRQPSGAWLLRWNRRDRYMNDWNSGTDVPMSEDDELYDVEVYYAGGALAETYYGVSGTSLLVPADLLGSSPMPTSITFKVWQLSAVVGRGFVASKTITQALT